MNNLWFKILKYFLYLLAALLVLFFVYKLGVLISDKIFGYDITAKFSELGPLSKNMPVYYKGYKIGKIKYIKPSEDYKTTDVHIILYVKKISLPVNTIAKVNKLDSGKDYIDIIYPETPEKEILKKGSIIEGKTAVDIESFMSAQADSGVLTSMSDNIQSTLKSLEQTSNTVGDFFTLFIAILEDNRANLKSTTSNAVKITQDLNKVSAKLDRVINEPSIKSTLANVDKSSQDVKAAADNLKDITQNVNDATKNLDKTIANIDSTICEVNSIASNVKHITNGFCEVLNKRFAGMRIMFGKPMKENNCGCQRKCLSVK